MSAFLSTLFAEFWPYLAGGVAIVLAYFGVRLKGKSDGRQEVQNQINKQAVEAAKEARDVQTKVNRMDVGAANAELRKHWMRKQ
ncbi:hypothetical protein LMG26842_02576 [Achromobacter dolens]|uniref:hypothetical protein n=1 Tax=Achromobacter dolens TaxID=1287738 RepID=UPI00146724C2|nr:hypothetical protein [Achromobacter dolens]CAB3845675.1 hypothetical protein LMG26842_02576 [Achromobacter dolens]